MTTKHKIEIPNLPEGWLAVAYRLARQGEYYWNGVTVYRALEDHNVYLHAHRIIVEKIQPRRIVLEETGETRQAVTGDWVQSNGFPDNFQRWDYQEPSSDKYKIWRVAEEE